MIMLKSRGAELRLLMAMTAILGTLFVAQNVWAPRAEAVAGLVKVASPLSPKNSSTNKSVSAKCPASKRVVGGGASIDDGGRGKVMLVQAQPVRNASGGDTFDAIAFEPSSGFAFSWTLRAFALCANALPGLGMITHSSETSSSTFKSVAVACPAGQRAISSGGLIIQPNGETGLQLSRTSGPLDITRVTAREDANGYSGSWTLLGFAMCADPIAGVLVQSSVFDAREGVVTCPGDTFVHGAGGGGSLTDPGPYFLQVIFLFNDLRRVHVVMTGEPDGGMVVQAVCAPGRG